MHQIIIEQRALQAEIQQYEVIKNDKKEFLARLKSENTYRQEKLEWAKQLKQKLKRERKTLLAQKSQAQSSFVRQKENKQISNFSTRLAKATSGICLTNYLNSFLELYNSQLDKNSKHKIEAVINPFPVINMKPKIQGMNSRTSSFRLDSETRFENLKITAFYYWGLNIQLVNEDRTLEEVLEELQITDESCSVFHLEDRVLDCFYNKGIQQTAQITLLLQDRGTFKKALNNIQVDSIKLQGAQKAVISNFQSIKANKSRIQKVNSYKFFFNKFPGVKSYISQIQILKEEEVRNQKQLELVMNKQEEVKEKVYEIDDMNCLIFSLLISLLILTIFSFSYLLDTKSNQFNFDFLSSMFEISQGGEFDQIETFDDFWLYMTDTFGYYILNPDQGQSPYRKFNEMVGTLQIRQLRQNLQSCKKTVNQHQNFSCYDPFYQNNDGHYETYRGFQYQSSSQLGYGIGVEGSFNTYTDGGYVVNFDRDMTQSKFQMLVNDLRKQFFTDEFTSVLIVSFASTNPGTNVWILGTLILERNIHNQLIPKQPYLSGFIPNIFYKNNILFAIQLSRLIIIFLFIVFMFYRIVIICHNQETKSQAFSKCMRYLCLEVGFMNFAIIVSVVVGFIYAINQNALKFDLQKLVNSNDPVNLELACYYYEQIRIYNSISVLFLFLRLAYILKANQRVSIIFFTFSKGFQELFAFITVQFPICIGLAFVFQVLFGDHVEQYSQFSKTLGSQIRMAQGRFSLTDFSNNEPILSAIVIVNFYFYVLFFITSLFQAIIIQQYRTVLMLVGYPQGADGDFSLADLYFWAFSWLQLFKRKQNDYEILKTNNQVTDAG
ncbi:hypothetical protein pb186bvf_008720 [Paramecium bursaria]